MEPIGIQDLIDEPQKGTTMEPVRGDTYDLEPLLGGYENCYLLLIRILGRGAGFPLSGFEDSFRHCSCDSVGGIRSLGVWVEVLNPKP